MKTEIERQSQRDLDRRGDTEGHTQRVIEKEICKQRQRPIQRGMDKESERGQWGTDKHEVNTESWIIIQLTLEGYSRAQGVSTDG